MDQQILTTATQQLDSLSLLNKVDSFYNNAWLKLMVFVTFLLTFVGIVIPFLVQWVQRRFFVLREDRIRGDLKKYCDDLSAKIGNDIDEKIKKIRKEITKELNGANAGVYHVQGNYFMSQNNYVAATESSLDSILYYLGTDDQANTQKAFNMLLTCLPKDYKEDIEKLEHDGYKFDSIIKQIDEANNDGRYSNYLRDIKKELSAVKQRSRK